MLLLLACTGVETDVPADLFPDGFRFGTATAGFQVEAGCPTRTDCVDPASDWYQWVTDPDLQAEPGLYLSGDPLTEGPGMWELFEEDAARTAADHMDGLRMGIEWSRIFPADASAATSVDDLAPLADPAAVARYHEMLASLLDHGVHPLVTVNHYTLPLWVHDGKSCHLDPDACTATGWVDGDTSRKAALYAGYLGREFGAQVDEWATLNEPMAIPLSGYLVPGSDRSNPPGLFRDGARAKATIDHQIEGSAAMYDALHAEDTADADGDGTAASVGIVMNLVDIAPRDPSRDLDLRAADHIRHVYHDVWLGGLTRGDWDDDLDGTFDRVRPELSGRLDWIGVNYYAQVAVGGLPSPLIDEIPAFDFVPVLSWVPAGDGMERVLAEAASYGVPVQVTENGLSSDRPEVRIASLEENLAAVKAAIDAGQDVRGYYYWSYVDNYEWNHGMDMRFGLYGLDPVTKDRVETPLMTRYREIAAARSLTAAE
jgi:beta-galactosidase